jgi:hypothetical protein
VLLSTRAPAEAIISVPGLDHERFAAENEYLVDRRCLGTVSVLEQFAQKERVPLADPGQQEVDIEPKIIGFPEDM